MKWVRTIGVLICGWWIRKAHVPWIVKKLGLKMSYLAYYRDVYVWLPDIRWTDVDCRPCCPTCKSNDDVGNHGFHANNFCRLVIGLRETYYVIIRIYRCYSCMRRSKELTSTMDEISDEVSTMVNSRCWCQTFVHNRRQWDDAGRCGYGLFSTALAVAC
jgi:hypothetical protein